MLSTRRRFFNAADNFVGGCYNKLSNQALMKIIVIFIMRLITAEMLSS